MNAQQFTASTVLPRIRSGQLPVASVCGNCVGRVLFENRSPRGRFLDRLSGRFRRALLLLAAVFLFLNPLGAQQPYDHSDLTVVRNSSGSFEPIKSVDDWNQRRDHILEGMQQAMGPLPTPRPPPDFDLQITERTSGNGFERLTINFVVEATDRLTAHLYLPTAREESEKRPAMLALHPTGAAGKTIIAGLAAGGKANRQYAMELAERGYVVLAPDYPGFGDLKDYDFAGDSYVSGTMKGIVNHMRCVDLLASRDEVDANRIGVIGHSLGGHNALFVAAFDQRLKVAVTSCGWTPFEYYYGGNVKGWTSDRYMPLIRDRFGLKAEKIPFDFYEVVSAISPRAVYSASPLRDSNFSVAGVKDAEPKIRSVFELHKSKQNFVVEYPDCEYDFPKAVRSRTYAFIDKQLAFDPVTNTNFAAELPRIPPTKPKDALDTFTVHPDFKLELIASEPDVVDPVAACFDAYGRLYVVEMRGYSEDRDKKLGRVRRLEDRNGDGFYEVSTVFADGLMWPTAITPYDGGVLVAAAPHIYYLKDGWTKLPPGLRDPDEFETELMVMPDDDRADKAPNGDYPIVLTGLKHTNVQGLANSMRWGLDGRIHVATSSSGAELVRAGRDDEPLVLRGRDFSFDPRIAKRTLLANGAAVNPTLEWSDEKWDAYEKHLIQQLLAFGGNEDDSLKKEVADRVERIREQARNDRRRLRFTFPRRPALRAESGGGQHGMCFDNEYRKFVCQNSDHIQFVRYEDRYAARAPNVVAPRSRHSIAIDGPQAEVFRLSQIEPWRLVRTRLRVSGLVNGPVEGGGRAAGYFTGATGTTIYRGNGWDPRYLGQAFVGDVGSNIVHRKILKRDGLGFRADRARENVEFIASTDNWFRPTQFLNGPDGHLYILDMYRETIEHPASLPPQIKKHVDLTSGWDRGRIYRITPADLADRKRKNRWFGNAARWYFGDTREFPAAANLKRLVELLGHPNAWTREAASRLLFEKQSRAAVEPLKSLAAKAKTPLTRMHALYALSNLRGARYESTLLAALKDPSAMVREHAVRISESEMGRSAEVRSAVAALKDDKEIRVRAQVAFSAFGLQEHLLPTVESLLRRDADNEIIRFAAVASATEHSAKLLPLLIASETFRGSVGGRTTLGMLADLAIKEGAAKDVTQLAVSLNGSDEGLSDLMLQKLVPHLVRSNNTKLLQELEPLSEATRQSLTEEDVGVEVRTRAARRLGLLPGEANAQSLLGLLVPKESQALQLAAIEALGNFRQPNIATGVLDVYQTLTPKVQVAAVGLLVSRDVWAEQLMAAFAEKRLPGHTLSVTQLNTLQSSRSDAIRELVGKLRAESESSSRSKVVADWQSVLQLKGDAANGRVVFRKTCAKCHKLEGFGDQIGPSLAAIRNRGVDAVLLSILDPNREVNPQYGSFVVVTKDGRSTTGMIANETASGVTLRDGEKVNATIARSEIDEIRNTGLSLMPEEIEKQMSKQDMADLLRYLMTVAQ